MPDRDRAGGEGATKAGGGEIGFDDPIDERAFSGSRSTDDGDDRPIGCGAVEMEEGRAGVAVQTLDDGLMRRRDHRQ